MAERRSRFKTILAFAAGLALAGLVGAALVRVQTLPLADVRFDGLRFADAETLAELVALPDSMRLVDVEPGLVEDRAERHPWVRSARATRLPSGTLAVRLEEREPVALALGGDGRPAFYLDAEGFMMPATPEALAAGFDVPLVTGSVPAYRPTLPVEDAALRRLLAVLPGASPAVDALVSGIERAPDGRLSLLVGPTPGGRMVPVALGRDGFAEKLDRLHAFWEQAVLTRPEHTVRRVDLRFAGQVVTEETAPPPAPEPVVEPVAVPTPEPATP